MCLLFLAGAFVIWKKRRGAFVVWKKRRKGEVALWAGMRGQQLARRCEGRPWSENLVYLEGTASTHGAATATSGTKFKAAHNTRASKGLLCSSNAEMH